MDPRRIRGASRAPLARRSLSAVVVLAPLLAAAPSFAEENAEQVAAARALGTEGVKLAEAGDCTNAVDKLSRAESLHHAPTTLERLGECHIALGRLVLGTEELQQVIREPLPPNAPAAFTQAQERARTAASAAQPRIAKLKIHVDHPAGVKPEVKVDAENVLDAMLDFDRPTDPGTHKVTATAPGMRPAETTVTLKDGEAGAASLKLEADPNAVVAPPVVAPVPTTAPAPAPAPASTEASAASSGGHGKVPAYVVLGIGVVGLGVGTVFGLGALSTKSTLDSACNANKGCPSSSQSDIDSLGSKATLSTIGFGVGIVGIAVGGWLFFTATDAPPAASAASVSPPKPRVQPFFGLNSAGFVGTF